MITWHDANGVTVSSAGDTVVRADHPVWLTSGQCEELLLGLLKRSLALNGSLATGAILDRAMEQLVKGSR